MSYQLTGTLIVVDPIIEVSDKFKKREFIVEEVNDRNTEYNDFHKFQLVNDKCDKVNVADIGSKITVDFNLKGRKWEKDGRTSYFTTLDAWKVSIEKTEPSSQRTTSSPMPAEEGDDLQF